MEINELRIKVATNLYTEEMLFKAMATKLGMDYYTGNTASSGDILFKLKVDEKQRGIVSAGPSAEKVINWSEIGLTGLRSTRLLFEEFCDNNQAIKNLALSSLAPFDPDPLKSSFVNYLSEELQPQLFQLWQRQLDDFKASL